MFRNSNKMKVLIHLLFLDAAIFTGRADIIPERTRRDGNQVPVGGKVGAYGSSSVNPKTDAQLGAEIGEGGAFMDYGLQFPNGFNEVGESFGAEAKTVARFDGEGQFNGGNIVGEYGLAPPSEGFGYGNQFKTAAQASASAEVYTGETVANGGTTPADTTTQAKLQAQFGQGVQHDAGTKVKTLHPLMSFNELMNAGDPKDPNFANFIKNQWLSSHGPGYVESLNNPYRGNTPRVPYEGNFIGIPQVDTDPSFIYYNGPPVYQNARPSSVPTNDTGTKEFKPTANGYQVTQSPKWIKKGLLYNNANWNPYTKPAQAETLVQMDRKIEADVLTQENGEPQYQKQTQANSVIQTNKGVEEIAGNADVYAETNAGYVGKYNAKTQPDVMVQINNGEPLYQKKTQANLVLQTNKGVEEIAGNADVYAETNAGYVGKYNAETQPDVMAQINNESQYETSAPADAVVQSKGGVQYSGKNKLTSSAQADAEFHTNVASSYSEGSQHNGGAHYVGGSKTKGAAQTSKGIKYEAKYSESAIYADTGIYNGGSSNGEGFQANAKSNLQSGVQFGGAVGAEAVAQAGIGVETRFGQSTHQPRRPMPGFGYRQPYNVRNQG